MLTVLFSACSSSDAAEGPKEATHQQPQLAIYVYAPEQASAKRNAAQTRADVGEVNPVTDEGITSRACRYGFTSQSQELMLAISAQRMWQL